MEELKVVSDQEITLNAFLDRVKESLKFQQKTLAEQLSSVRKTEGAIFELEVVINKLEQK